MDATPDPHTLTPPTPVERSADGATPGAALPPPAPPRPTGARSGRALFLVPGGVCLLAGLDAALLRAELWAPVRSDRLADHHGMLMVLGFLGTLIALERAVALRHPAGYAAPALLGAGGLALVAPVPPVVAQVLLLNGCIALVAVYVALWRRQHDDGTTTQIAAAVLAACAVLLWLRVDMVLLLPWLTGFLVLTIAAERVELARLSMGPGAGRLLVAFAAALLATAVVALLWPVAGARLLGVVLLGLVVWLARGDVARRTIRSRGLPRFSAAALLLGYAWLAVAAVTWLVGGMPGDVPAYDTVVHAVFLGFAMSMVLAHAPVILPAVLRRPLPYHPVMWVPLLVLQAGMAARVVGGNLLGGSLAWQVGSAATVVALLLLVVTAAGSSASARRRP